MLWALSQRCSKGAVVDWRRSRTCRNYSLPLPIPFLWWMQNSWLQEEPQSPQTKAQGTGEIRLTLSACSHSSQDFKWLGFRVSCLVGILRSCHKPSCFLVNLLGWMCFSGRNVSAVLSCHRLLRQSRVADGLVALMPWHCGTRLASQGTQMPGKSFSLRGLWNPHGHLMELPMTQNGPEEWFVFWGEGKLGKMSLLNSRRSKMGQSFSLNPSFAEMIWPQGAVQIDCKAAEPLTWATLQQGWVF